MTPEVSSGRMPVVLLTGFLGAGKTTLLLRWLEEAPATGLRMGVVMNEFGSDSVDSQLIRKPGLAVRQVDGGCVCCAPESDLDKACRELVRSGACDFIVLETSGLADPDNVIDVLTDEDLLDAVELRSVVTVLDAAWFLRPEGGEAERVLARRQVEYADVVALSRCDLLGPGEAEAIESLVAQWNRRARFVRLPFGLPDIGLLLAGSAGCRDVEDSASTLARNPGEHLHQRYRSFSWRFPTPVSRRVFETFLTGLDPRQVVRAKGFVRFSESPSKIHVFQRVWGHVLIEEFPAKPDPSTFGVLIGPDLDVDGLRARLRSMTGSGAIALGTR